MFLQATKNSDAIEIILKQINLVLVWQVVASRVERVYVDSGQSQIMQILVQSLLCCQFAAVREMVTPEQFVDIMIDIRVLPLDIE